MKKSDDAKCTSLFRLCESGRRDLNPRPPEPHQVAARNFPANSLQQPKECLVVRGNASIEWSLARRSDDSELWMRGNVQSQSSESRAV